MIGRLLKRAATFALSVAGVFVVTRALVRALPGDPVETLIQETGSLVSPTALRQQLHLDQPFWSATLKDLIDLIHGNWGHSLLNGTAVGPLLAPRITHTASLALTALALALLIAVPLGLAAAAHRGSRTDRFCSHWGAITAAIPSPWLGPLLMLIFGVWLPLFPVSGHLALPALTLGLTISGLWARLIRERVTESLALGAAPSARARGLSETRVLLKYGLAPVSGALIGALGTQLGGLLAGALITEVVFDWPGLGSFLTESILKRDYPLVQAGVFVTATLTLAGIWLGEGMRQWADPRE